MVGLVPTIHVFFPATYFDAAKEVVDGRPAGRIPAGLSCITQTGAPRGAPERDHDD